MNYNIVIKLKKLKKNLPKKWEVEKRIKKYIKDKQSTLLSITIELSELNIDMEIFDKLELLGPYMCGLYNAIIENDYSENVFIRNEELTENQLIISNYKNTNKIILTWK